MEVAKNEKELNALSWWKGLDKGTKNSISRLEYGSKKSYKKLNKFQIMLLYSRWN